ncbi:MAG: hypothetical protein J1F20_01635 [Muribaculaceae bacterium]|nr:hypothetical protein [Muribaculaceae bacterium]
MRIVVFTFIIFVYLISHGATYPLSTDNYLDSIDINLAKADFYTQQALSQIEAKRKIMSELPVDKQMELYAEIGAQAELIDADMAMDVYCEAEQLAADNNDVRYIKKFTYRKGSVMPMMGLVREGIELFNSVTPDQVDVRDKFDYFNTGHHIFDAAVDYYRVDSLKSKYKALSVLYADSVLAYVEPGSKEEVYYKALPKLTTVNRMTGINELEEILSTTEITDPLFAKAAAEIALAYANAQDWNLARYYLALSALADLKAGTRETTSLHRLGRVLNRQGDYSRAYDYLVHSLESAIASGSNMRTLEISDILPVVIRAGHQLEIRRSRTLLGVVIALSVAVIICIAVWTYTFRTRNRLNRMQKQLVVLNDSKDRYISKLISLCGAYLTALENFNILVGRKVKVGQINELMAMIESGKVIREQLQAFHEVFDDAFLSIYPDFVERVNELLQDDKKLPHSDDGPLGTELRILAFMRLGLEDSSQIAKFLGLSLNTVYTYRNKVKTRALNRDTFEHDVRNIGRNRH